MKEGMSLEIPQIFKNNKIILKVVKNYGNKSNNLDKMVKSLNNLPKDT